MKLDDFYHLVCWDYCLYLYYYIHNVSADASFDCPQRTREPTRNFETNPLINLRNQIEVLNYSKISLLFTCSHDWSRIFLIIPLKKAI